MCNDSFDCARRYLDNRHPQLGAQHRGVGAADAGHGRVSRLAHGRIAALVGTSSPPRFEEWPDRRQGCLSAPHVVWDYPARRRGPGDVFKRHTRRRDTGGARVHTDYPHPVRGRACIEELSVPRRSPRGER